MSEGRNTQGQIAMNQSSGTQDSAEMLGTSC